jgi:hypothetical protein
MLKRTLVILITLFFIVINIQTSAAEDKGGMGSRAKKEDNIYSKIIENTIGRDKYIRSEDVEPSHIKGWKQKRVWVKSPYGERPILIYMPEGKEDIYIIGSVFDAAGTNLTEANVGSIKPKVIKESDMDLNDDFRIGPKNAKVRTVLWIGTDLSSKFVFDNIYYIYLQNKDKMNIYIKFFPRGSIDYEKTKVLTCFRGEAFESALKTIIDAVPGWGTDKDLKAFKDKRGVDDSQCDDGIIKRDLALASELNLPGLPTVFVNGTILLDPITKESLGRLSGEQLN